MLATQNAAPRKQVFFLPTLMQIMLLCLAPNTGQAAEADCRELGVNYQGCRDPILTEWKGWKAQVGTAQRPAQASEQEAINDAVAALRLTYPCGLSFAVTETPYTPIASTWDWPSQEESGKVSFFGFQANTKGACIATASGTNGVVKIRRERRVACPDGFGWLARDGKPALCVKD